MSEKTAYIVVDVRIENVEAYERYKQKVVPIVSTIWRGISGSWRRDGCYSGRAVVADPHGSIKIPLTGAGIGIYP